MSKYHQPVMLNECIEHLAIKPEGTYVDVTFGGGGHSEAILEKLNPEGKLFAFDQDDAVLPQAEKLAKKYPNFKLIQSNFKSLKAYLKLYGIKEIDGLLADLGVSSHQIDTAERGFSTRFEGELDMRMDRNSEITAQTIIKEYSEKELHKILGQYGEVKNAKTLAKAITITRFEKEIQTVEDLKAVLQKYAPRGKENKYFAQVFQAFRIEVNEELKVLEELLLQSAELLKPTGRLVVMSYHSLEDRLVKNFIQKGKFYGEVEKDFYGNPIKPLEAIIRKPIVASEAEIEENRRARSAKLRVASKIVLKINQ